MFCPNCGKEISDEATFCPECGFRIPAAQMPEQPVTRQAESSGQGAAPADNFYQKPAGQPAASANTAYQSAPAPKPAAGSSLPGVDSIPFDYKPISMWGYFGYQILFMIPVIGFICLLVFAFGGSNKNVKNYARSFFCVWILYAIFAVVIALVFGSAFALDSMF